MDKRIKRIRKEILNDDEVIIEDEDDIKVLLRKKHEKSFNLKRKVIAKLLDKEWDIVEEDKDTQLISFK